MTNRPLRDPSVLSRVVEDSVVLYDPKSETVHTLNETARVIWECCDGRSIQEIADRIASLFDTSEAEALAGVRRALQRFWELNLISAGAEESK